MMTQEVLDAIIVLAKVVEANNSLFGSQITCDVANEKIQELIGLLKK